MRTEIRNNKRVEILEIEVSPLFLKHLEARAKIYANTKREGKIITAEQYAFTLIAVDVRNDPLPTQTKEEVANLA